MDLIRIGQYIAGKRKALGLTQKQLAEKLGVSDKSVSKWERGVCLPDVSLYTELCAALGIGINEFLSGDDIAENDLPRRAEENILQTAADGKRRQKRLKCMVAALLIVSAAALSIIGAYLIRTNRPENVIRPVEKESTEMQTLKLIAGLDGAYMYRYTASDDFLSLRIYLTEYHFGKQVRKENWELSYRDIGSPKEGTILIVPDFENFQVKLILADGGSKLSTSFPILEGEENRKYFARAGASIEDETPITFEAEQPLLALMYSENDLQLRAVQEFAAGSASPVNDYAYYISLEFCKAEQKKNPSGQTLRRIFCYAKIIFPKNSGRWKSGAAVSTAFHARKCGCTVLSPHL